MSSERVHSDCEGLPRGSWIEPWRGVPGLDIPHGSEVSLLDLAVGDPAVALGGGDPAVAEQLLDGDEIGLGVRHELSLKESLVYENSN